MKGECSEKISSIEGELYHMKENLKTQIEENVAHKIKMLEKKLVKIPVTEENRDCFLQSPDRIKLSPFDCKSS